jgi:hypothetical protein
MCKLVQFFSFLGQKHLWSNGCLKFSIPIAIFSSFRAKNATIHDLPPHNNLLHCTVNIATNLLVGDTYFRARVLLLTHHPTSERAGYKIQLSMALQASAYAGRLRRDGVLRGQRAAGRRLV